ncbi:single-stranded DNA-binding protein [Congzhengia minquanensis]|uniref:Single-stranded DNA-binding protein n=1 Tax=Congzhengia minquanensis TaxID=2763657 RepID=A0A926DMH3_9FIRM|nr:single-stranded DNA-binding protein [Congzhengia minquanensis]MBC8540551.1 single-stranded DNA-binding protein [Congzhengia minquanensis]
MNKVILVGRLTKDPELRATTSGIPVCSFTVACDRRFVKQGEERKADFINCIAWRQAGESISKYFAKGHRIALEGSIQTRSWTDNEGKTRYSTEVVVDQWEFAQSKSENGASASYQPSSSLYPPQQESSQSPAAGDIDGFMPIEEEDLPF